MPSSKQDKNSTPYDPQEYENNIVNTIPYYSSIHQEIINLVKAFPIEAKVWMDTGCGTGSLVNSAMQEFPNTKFLLLDPSENMLEIAKEKMLSQPKGRIEFLEPSPTQEFSKKLEERPDIITAIQCHHYLSPEYRAEATKVCFELLKSGGAFITFENIRPLTEEGVDIGKEYLGNFQLSRGKDKENVSKYLARFDVEYFPLTIEQHLQLLRNTGFKVVEMFWYSYMQAGFYCIK
ncbi:class I SAM-dependent methyltransferase [Methanolobus sp. ZRKC3]|uniref:class I SAM-dependent methyltransferase n=1 Tax=Methanolobus sp. ZRKC3 TaxID=3125786 RepID=UPI003255D19B